MVLSRFEYLAEINRLLMEHADYEPGMEFVFFPPGSSAEEASGFAWVPADAEEPMRSIAVQTAGEMEVMSPLLESESAVLA